MVFLGKILEDVRNVALGFIVDVRVLDVKDNLVATPFKSSLDRSVAVRKIGTVDQRRRGIGFECLDGGDAYGIRGGGIGFDATIPDHARKKKNKGGQAGDGS